LAVVGGLLFSQILTLYVTPVFYLYMETFREWLQRRPRSSALAEDVPAFATGSHGRTPQ
jgi:HAE1 family hydrophobic/amphiphilic exporter-1